MPEDNTVNIVLPEGMTIEQFNKSFTSYRNMQEYTKKRDKAVRNALNTLRDKYPADYKTFLDKELRKVGLPVK